MNLVIDIGNTFWKIGLFEETNLIHMYRLEREDAIQKVKQLLIENKIEYSSLSNVSQPEIELTETLDQATTFISFELSKLKTIQLNYSTPNTLGKDRISGVLGAYSMFPDRNLLVIDAGTCITYDILTDQKEYLGGAISPGVKMRFKALHNFTANLPLVEPKEKAAVTGDSTEHSILSGVMNGVKGEIEDRISYYKENYPDLIVVGTGGDIPFFDKEVKNTIFADPNLILKGLNFIILNSYRDQEK